MTTKPLTQWSFIDFVEHAKTINRKTWLKIASIFGIGIVFIWIIVIPAWFGRYENQWQIGQIQAQLSKFEMLRKNKPQMIEERQKASKFIQQSKDRLYAPGEASLILGSISRIAESTNVQIVASSPRDQKNTFPIPFNQQYESTLYDFTVEGPYHNLGSFVSQIESHPKLLRIQSFNLRTSDESAEKQMADISLSATSFKGKK